MVPIVSIIIPVYNTGPYLKRCIDSISSQTLRDIEIIIVDDGSEQLTAELCDQLASEDSRIRVLHKKNEGVSVARNVGMSIAIGEYIGFVDSDDWIAHDMYSSLVSVAEQESCDITMCDALTIRDGKKEEIDTFTRLMQSAWLSKEEITPNILCEIAGVVWRAIYRRRFIEAQSLSFPVGIKFSEDRIFNLIALGRATGFYYLKQPFYYRYVRKGSAAYGYHSDAAEIIKKAYTKIENILNVFWCKDDYYKVYKWQELALFYGTMNAIYQSNGLTVCGRYKKMKELSGDSEFLDVLSITRATDIRAKLVQNNQVALLCLMTFFVRLKHKLLNQ